MCYYDNYKFTCQDWKWGNFRQHCVKEYRTGETCGMKMIYNTIPLMDKCPWCEKIEKKMRRRAKALSDIERWKREGSRYRASIERAEEEVETLDNEIRALTAEKDRRYASIGNTRRG